MTSHHLAQIAKTTGLADRLLIDDWPELKAFAEAVAALAKMEEREACAQVCEEFYTIEGIAQRCADGIRARGTR
jgi:hypothetical protein